MAKPDDEHDEQDTVAVDDAVCPDGQVPAFGGQPAVEDDGHDTGGGVHQERRHADGKDVLDDFFDRFERVLGKADESIFSQEEVHGLDRRDEHGDDRGDSRSLDAPVEPKDENGSQDGVDHHAPDHDGHGER